ncbi:NAD(P)/FAD-dependent oxidoreductase [Limimaricola pyoseonensis]|uniref:D-amino-acid dehydrogenase n=1 Tax=Limimaricola pyoseonensis TaxID=521013 RepID=A0A1G7HTV9_9RHOB|nr:FAD-dependent oxidoreductase [Limimaricola pyoseonensis]SDF03768.1 D-amino-acid dehydrogenase [Limimaricola pyoseonensis]
MRIAIIGAGIVGAAVAFRLAQAGHAITMFEPAPAGRPASYGNAGHVGTASILPWASSANLSSAFSCHRDPRHPLVLHPSDLLRQPRWVARFLGACGRARHDSGVRALAGILANADDALSRLMTQAGCARLRETEGLLHVYLSEETRQGAEPGLALRRAHGIPCHRLSAAQLFDLEPELVARDRRGMVRGATLFPGVSQIVSPHRLVEAFRAASGVQPVAAAVSKIEIEGERLRVRTPGETHVFDGVVIAAGRDGARLAAPHGARVPVIAERGYHRQYDAAARFRRSALFVDMRVVASPTLDGLRLTTGAEFCRPHRKPDHARMAPVFSRAVELLGQGAPPSDIWSGDRPSTPDSRPVLGPAPRSRRIFLAYGHGHLGLTMSGITAEIAKAHFDGATPPTDLAPFRPDR